MLGRVNYSFIFPFMPLLLAPVKKLFLEGFSRSLRLDDPTTRPDGRALE